MGSSFVLFDAPLKITPWHFRSSESGNCPWKHFCSFLFFFMYPWKLPWGTFGLGKAGYCTHKNVHGYGAFKGKSISSLLFCKRQVSLLSLFYCLFCPSLLFFLPLTFSFSAHSIFFLFFFFFAAHFFLLLTGCLKNKDEIKIKTN